MQCLMQCNEVREFFSPYLDGELAREKIEGVQQHLEGCPACREEFSRWQELSRALRVMQAPVAAPPGFAAAVLRRVAERRPARPWQGVRRWVATAAAVALLAAGSISYATRGVWQHLPAPVARVQQGDGQQLAINNPYPDLEQPGTNLPPDSGYSQPVKTGKQQPDSGNAPGRKPLPETSPGNENERHAATPDSDKPGQQPTQLAGAEPYTARTFLSAGRQATSTMLKITVADMAGARTRALSLAAGSGATVQVIADQDNGQVQRVIYQIAVPEEKVAALAGTLSGLGQVIAKNTTTQDLTQQFSATLEQYQAKVAQVNAAADPAEKGNLTREAKALEQQLSTWDQETKQETIILWLETK